MQEQDYKTIARSRLTDRHRSDESFLAILDTLIELKEERQREYLSLADTFLDIDKSTGKNLDVIGRLIGEERTLVNFIDRSYFGFLGARLSESYDIGYWYSLYKNKYGTLRTLTDEEYRRVLKARVVKNSSDNNRNSFIEVLNILSGNTNSSVIESQNNTAITVNVEDTDGLVSYYLSKYKNDRNLIPVPLGRRLNVNHVTSNNGGGNGGDTDPEPFGVTDFEFYSSGNNHLGRFQSLTFTLSGFSVNEVIPWHIQASFNFYPLNLKGYVSNLIAAYNNGMGIFTLNGDSFGVPAAELTESSIRNIFQLSTQDGKNYFHYRGHRAGVLGAGGQGMQDAFSITPHTPLKAWTP